MNTMEISNKVIRINMDAKYCFLTTVAINNISYMAAFNR